MKTTTDKKQLEKVLNELEEYWENQNITYSSIGKIKDFFKQALDAQDRISRADEKKRLLKRL